MDRYTLTNARNAVRATEHHLAHMDEYRCGHSREALELELAGARARLASVESGALAPLDRANLGRLDAMRANEAARRVGTQVGAPSELRAGV